MTLNAVVLPAPFGPIRPTISPARTENVMSAMATRPWKCTATCSIDRTVSARALMSRCAFGWLELHDFGRLALPARQGPLDRRHDALRQGVDDKQHQHPVDDPLQLGLDRHGTQHFRQESEDCPAHDWAGQRPFTSGD